MVSKKVVLGVLFFVGLALVGVQAQSDLADWQYDQALAAFNKGDCSNSSVHAKLALDRYTSANNIPGIEKTNALIVKINDCLKPIGDAYYIQALNYYTKALDYLNSADHKNARTQLDQSMSYLQLAKSAYMYLIPEDLSRLTQVNTKMADINAKIAESETLKANELYLKAIFYVEKQDYGLALDYVDNASAICAQYGNTACVQRCNELRDGIRRNLAVLIDRAKYFYEKGMEAYTSATCTNDKYFDAVDNFKQARATYLSARDYEQVKNCDYILNRTNEALQVCMQQLINSLDESIREATTRIILAEENCSEYIGIMQLVRTTHAHASLLLDRFQMPVFADRMTQCAGLVTQIKLRNASCGESYSAETMYNTAATMFQNAEYENASVLARKSKVIFERAGDWAGVTKVDRLLDSNNKMLLKVNESNGYYKKSQEYLKVADYENASLYVMKAKELYTDISRVKDVAKCDVVMADIRNGNLTRGKADAYYAEAVQKYDIRDFGTARIKADAAKDLYKKINDVEGIAKVDALIKKIPDQDKPFVPPLVLLIVGAVLFIVLIWTRTKTSREKTEKTSVADKKKSEEEQRLAELEAERKKREEEKERMMLERKRLKEMLAQEKKAIKGERAESRDNIGENGRAFDGNGVGQADRQQTENERELLEKILGQDREALKSEKAVISEQLGLKRDKMGGKHEEIPIESEEVISDREKIKEIVDNPADHEPDFSSSKNGLDEIEKLRELIKKEREAMKKSESDGKTV
jgi:tetratricopeptide (TPR) repeat protein